MVVRLCEKSGDRRRMDVTVKVFNDGATLCNVAFGVEFRLGVGSYEGRALFKELRITDAEGKVVYSNDFPSPDAVKGWISAGRGAWKCGGGTLAQTFGGLGHEAATLTIPLSALTEEERRLIDEYYQSPGK